MVVADAQTPCSMFSTRQLHWQSNVSHLIHHHQRTLDHALVHLHPCDYMLLRLALNHCLFKCLSPRRSRSRTQITRLLPPNPSTACPSTKNTLPTPPSKPATRQTRYGNPGRRQLLGRTVTSTEYSRSSTRTHTACPCLSITTYCRIGSSSNLLQANTIDYLTRHPATSHILSDTTTTHKAVA